MTIEADSATAGLLSALFPSSPDRSSGSVLSVRLRGGAPDPRAGGNPDWQVAERWARGEQLRVRGSEGARMIFDPYSRSVSALGPDGGSVWFDTSAGFLPWVVAAPALQLFDWWATGCGMLATHAAATCFGGGAVLLIGPGGSGKSTFAVEAAERGHGFLGDDYVLVEPGERPRVHGLYRTAKLDPARAGEMSAFSLLAEGEDGDEKHVFLADERVLVRSAPLRAVIAPVIGDGPRPRLTPITAAEAVRRAAPSILRQMPGMEPAKLALLSQTVRSVPCYRLELCPDHGQNIHAVEALVTTDGEVADG